MPASLLPLQRAFFSFIAVGIALFAGLTVWLVADRTQAFQTDALSRAEIDEETVAAMNCLGVSCLSMASPADQAPGSWEVEPEAEITLTPPYDLMAPDGTHSPAAVLDQLKLQQAFSGISAMAV